MVLSMMLQEEVNQIRISEDMRASDLLCCNGREWNHELLDHLFMEENQAKIKAINPVGGNSDDTYAWEYTKSGYYTVKSAYWVQTNVLAVEKESMEITQPSLDAIYQKVWNLDTSPKLQHFLWRGLINALPVAENMAHRHIACDKRSSRCGAETRA